METRSPTTRDFDEDVETVSLRVLGARNFEGGDSSTTKACVAKLLRGSWLLPRIQDEPRWHGADQFIVGRAERRAEVSYRQIQNARQRAFKGQDEVWIARRSAQMSISSREQGLRFEESRHLAVSLGSLV